MHTRRIIKSIIFLAALAIVLIVVFYGAQNQDRTLLFIRKVAKHIMHYGLISLIVAIFLTYFYNRYIRDVLVQSRDTKSARLEAEAMRARHERLEEKVRKLTAELCAAKLKLGAEIANCPPDQRELHQRLQHLNCLYGLSKIVNRQKIPLDQIFRKTVCLIRDAYRYPSAMCVRIIFDGIRYEGDDFKKTELGRRAPIKAHGEDVGMIEVYHLGGKIERDEEVFVREEDDLLRAVAEWIGSIAERKQAEEKLRLFRSLIERSNDCIFAVEPKWGRILDVNTRACDSLGYTRKELLNMMTITDIEEPSSEDFPWAKQIEVLSRKGDIVKEGLYRRKDGTTFCVETSLKLVPQEKQDYIIAIARDITERKRAEAKLKAAQDKLIETAREVGMAEVATGVLHNVGNVLNSVSVTAGSIKKRVRSSKISYLADVVKLFDEHSEDLGRFMTTEEQGKKLPAFMAQLSRELVDEQERCLEALEALTKHVQHVADIIQLQQSHSKPRGLIEPVSLGELVDDAIQINAETMTQNNVTVRRELADLPILLLDRHKVLQILTNLISNAIYALSKNDRDDRILEISAHQLESEYVRIEVCDNGVGIPKENLTRIFEHGFTTKEKGHGFGLHSTALSVSDLNGSIKAHSDGPGKGAVFVVELPFKTQEATT